MRFATRLNSFLNHGMDIAQALRSIASVEPGAAVDFNYVEHFSAHNATQLRGLLSDNGLVCNGAAVRYRDEFLRGEFGDARNGAAALALAKRTIDAIRELGGTTLTIWLSYDGADYPFQADFARDWQRVVAGFREIADYAGDIKVSVEFKPYEPRAYSLLSGTGYSLHLLHQIDRKNVGITLDFCHMLMARENPAFGVAIVGAAGKLFGVHLNDGYGQLDDGLMFGSVNPARAVEFVYFLKRSGYDGTVYFDTFPAREDPVEEFRLNVDTYRRIERRIDLIGMEAMQSVIDSRDGIETQRLLQQLFY